MGSRVKSVDILEQEGPEGWAEKYSVASGKMLAPLTVSPGVASMNVFHYVTRGHFAGEIWPLII